MCKRETIVGVTTPYKEDNYICYSCVNKTIAVPQIFGRKTRRKAKRKALKAGKQIECKQN